MKYLHGRVMSKEIKHRRALELNRFCLWNTTSHGRVVKWHGRVLSEFKKKNSHTKDLKCRVISNLGILFLAISFFLHSLSILIGLICLSSQDINHVKVCLSITHIFFQSWLNLYESVHWHWTLGLEFVRTWGFLVHKWDVVEFVFVDVVMWAN